MVVEGERAYVPEAYALNASDVSKFKVTPGGSPLKNWIVKYDADNGGKGILKSVP